MTKATGPLFDVHFRRRRQSRTNYAKRLALLKNGSPRLVIRKFNKGVSAQIVEFSASGDKTVCQASTRDLQLLVGFQAKRNVPSAYLLGFLVAKRALAKGVTSFISDFGLHTASKGGVLFAVVKGAIDGGLKSSVSEEVLPTKERLMGKHINADASSALAKIKEMRMEGSKV